MNSVVIVGRTGQDPEIKFVQVGAEHRAVTTFSLAVNRWNPKTKAQDTDWFNVQIWGKKAESASEWVKKGSLISVEGRIKVDRWQGQDGETAERYLINATDFNFVGSKKDSQTVNA